MVRRIAMKLLFSDCAHQRSRFSRNGSSSAICGIAKRRRISGIRVRIRRDTAVTGAKVSHRLIQIVRCTRPYREQSENTLRSYV